MRCVLIIADLEGIAGVEGISELIAQTSGHGHARERMTTELRVVLGALSARGVERLRVVDSHASGSEEPSFDPRALPAGTEWLHPSDPYGPELFSGVDAVVCLGMHAPASSSGFAAHTVNLHCKWLCDGRELSETELALGIASELGVPVLLVTGDDLLEAHLGGRVPFLRTKLSVSPERAANLDLDTVHLELDRLLRLNSPVPSPGLPDTPLRIVFKSSWQARAAMDRGARLVDRETVEVSGANFVERYQNALRLVETTAETLGLAVRGPLGSDSFAEDVTQLLLRRFPEKAPCPDLEAIRSAYRALLRLTDGGSSEHRALRALTLHMLESHAPSIFSALSAADELDRALAELKSIPMTLSPSLDPDEAQARVDAFFLQRVRGLGGPSISAPALAWLLRSLRSRGEELYAFVIGEVACASGVDVRLTFEPRPHAELSRLENLYWLSHEFFFATEYLTKPLPPLDWEARIEEVMLAIPWVIAAKHVDLAAELAMCLQASGEERSDPHRSVVEFLVGQQRADGSLWDFSFETSPEELVDHCTAGALLALAGAAERGLA